jgi:hypothetical protein
MQSLWHSHPTPVIWGLSFAPYQVGRKKVDSHGLCFEALGFLSRQSQAEMYYQSQCVFKILPKSPKEARKSKPHHLKSPHNRRRINTELVEKARLPHFSLPPQKKRQTENKSKNKSGLKGAIVK